jgi:hypothetical protein
MAAQAQQIDWHLYVEQGTQLLAVQLLPGQQQAVTVQMQQLAAIATELMATPIPATLESLANFEP